MQLPKTKTVSPTTVQSLKECTPEIPQQLDLFFRTLLDGITPAISEAQRDSVDRKVNAMSSDAVFNRKTVEAYCTRSWISFSHRFKIDYADFKQNRTLYLGGTAPASFPPS